MRKMLRILNISITITKYYNKELLNILKRFVLIKQLNLLTSHIFRNNILEDK